MQTITIQANESFIKEIKEMIKHKAKALNEKVSFKNESKAIKVDTIKEQLLQDIKDYKAGKLETQPLGTSWKYL